MKKPEDNFEEELITLTDEDGHEHEFAILDVIEVDEHEYAILVPAAEQPEGADEEQEDAVILRLETDDQGEEILVDIEDDEEWNRVAQAWDDLMDSEDDEDAGEDEDEE